MWRQPSERDSKFTPSHSDLTSKNRVLEHGPRFFVCYEDGLERCCAQNNPAVSVLRAKIHQRWRHLKKSVDQPEFGTQYVFCHSTESGFAAIIFMNFVRIIWLSAAHCPEVESSGVVS